MKYLVLFYQKYLSKLTGQSCRYYPTCSHYALIVLKKDNLLFATFKIIKRILRCNQLFAGGIEYPIVNRNFTNVCYKQIDVKYWYIPAAKGYIIIKSLTNLKD